MKCQLTTHTPESWARKTHIAQYAWRQAESCTYLEALFDDVLARCGKPEPGLSEPFARLRSVHRRQRADLELLVDVPASGNRRSFYFDSLYTRSGLCPSELPSPLSEDHLLTVLAIQGVSYLRGQDRYRVLKDYTCEDNRSFTGVWARFFDDATGNAQQVWGFICSRFGEARAQARAEEAVQVEDDLMHLIWRHNDVA